MSENVNDLLLWKVGVRSNIKTNTIINIRIHIYSLPFLPCPSLPFLFVLPFPSFPSHPSLSLPSRPFLSFSFPPSPDEAPDSIDGGLDPWDGFQARGAESDDELELVEESGLRNPQGRDAELEACSPKPHGRSEGHCRTRRTLRDE